MDRVKQCCHKTQSQNPIERLPKRPRTPHVFLVLVPQVHL